MTEARYKKMPNMWNRPTTEQAMAELKKNIKSPEALARAALEIAGQLHPDGCAWKKCCRGDEQLNPGRVLNCAFIDKRITADISKNHPTRKIPFVCIHQQDGEYLRVCAGWDACFGKDYKAPK